MPDKIINTMLGGLTHERVRHEGEIIVIGLGRFGSALATTLIELGYEVLGVDSNPEIVQNQSGNLTHVVQADTTNVRALRQIGAADAVTAVVCIGTGIEASVLTTAALADLGVKNIWAKAITEPHGHILRRVGAHNVVFPEADMGQRVAHLVTGQLLEFLALDEDFVIGELAAPDELIGVPLGNTNLRAQYKVTVVCVKPAGGQFTYADRDTVLSKSDLIVIAGHRADVERFSERD
ncbi:trk system potassium uptake protein TrkA [Ilumatobacter fluminis]|uniref:Trk system potassium uptake protein TrkA n=1 Tax=Ilumatobacter fluminis TaxID=467091 RepID=A0A4R7I315_9ACTN|nr:TrkA family potassium uptake protein [Ilumatobacter fluminis]TDT17594.1 trk system potassium uptake protein TrkA [Ilumatobacter fluminis]